MVKWCFCYSKTSASSTYEHQAILLLSPLNLSFRLDTTSRIIRSDQYVLPCTVTSRAIHDLFYPLLFLNDLHANPDKKNCCHFFPSRDFLYHLAWCARLPVSRILKKMYNDWMCLQTLLQCFNRTLPWPPNDSCSTKQKWRKEGRNLPSTSITRQRQVENIPTTLREP